MLAIGLIVIGILSRLIPHAPNFTPVIAVALFSGAALSKRSAVAVPLLLLMISDVFIGLHPTIIFTWSSVVLISSLGFLLREKKAPLRLAGTGLTGAVLFFMITNFGVWLVYYAHTWEGLLRCFSLAVPFFRNTVLSTLLYGAVLFGTYEWASRRVRESKFAHLV